MKWNSRLYFGKIPKHCFMNCIDALLRLARWADNYTICSQLQWCFQIHFTILDTFHSLVIYRVCQSHSYPFILLILSCVTYFANFEWESYFRSSHSLLSSRNTMLSVCHWWMFATQHLLFTANLSIGLLVSSHFVSHKSCTAHVVTHCHSLLMTFQCDVTPSQCFSCNMTLLCFPTFQ